MSRIFLRGGRVICPATGVDRPGTVVIEGERVVEVAGPEVEGAGQELDVSAAS